MIPIDDSHVQHTWHLARGGEEVTIDLWTDNDTVRVDGGDDEATEGGRPAVERLLAKYTAAGYRLQRDYAVNDAETHDEPVDDDVPDHKPEQCPECTSTTFDYAYNHVVDFRQGDAWLCTGCKWGQWVTA